jgi:hypothetical protein
MLGALPTTAPDPISPDVNIDDFLRVQTMRITPTDTVTWASGTNTAPSKSRSRWVLPKVGMLGRIILSIDGASSTGYDLTIGGGAAAVAANGLGPWGVIDRITLRVNGGSAWYDVSGFGTMLLNALSDDGWFPESGVGTVYSTSPRSPSTTVFNYPVAADGRPRFELEIPMILRQDLPFGLLLLQNDQTTVELEIAWNNLDSYAALTGGAVAVLSLTVTPIMEYFDVPPRSVFDSLILPLLRWAHWHNELRQDIVSQGRDANIVKLDNHDTYLRVVHFLTLNSVLNVDNVGDVRFRLNGNTFLYDHDVQSHLRMQRETGYGRDLPAIIWNWFSSGKLRDAIRADMYTSVESVLDISGATLGTGPNIRTVTEKLVDLGLPSGA